MDFNDSIAKALAFRDERDWKQFHNPKDLAISISLEAAELLENFQWSGQDLEKSDSKENMKEELADILIYCIYMADSIGCDIPTIIDEKIKSNRLHYPVEKARGSSKKYDEL